MTTQRTAEPGTARARTGRRGSTAVGILVFAAVIAAIVGWIVLARPVVAENTAAERPTATSTATASPTPSPSAAPSTETVVPPAPVSEVPEPVVTTPAAPATQAQSRPPAESSFLGEVKESGLAPPIPDEAQLQMARDICQAFEEGATFPVLVDTFVNMGATRTEADGFIRNATVSFCPQHTPAG